MPELPEVETIRRGLRRKIIGKKSPRPSTEIDRMEQNPPIFQHVLFSHDVLVSIVPFLQQLARQLR